MKLKTLLRQHTNRAETIRVYSFEDGRYILCYADIIDDLKDEFLGRSIQSWQIIYDVINVYLK